MKKALILSLAILSGCASMQSHESVSIIASEDTIKNPSYHEYYEVCHNYASRITQDVSKNAMSGALAGAGIASLIGLIVGIDGGYARLAGLGALSGGLSSAAGTKMSNDQKYKEIMLRCLREKGYEVY